MQANRHQTTNPIPSTFRGYRNTDARHSRTAGRLRRLVVAGVLALSAANLRAQILYQDDFDAGTSGSSWTAQLSASDAVANFAFDYSTLGIPSAPNSVGGSTIGMGFLVNQSEYVFQGISATPNGQSFAGDFRLSFDLWFNYAGPLGPGGDGTTQIGSFGWGVNGASAEWAGASSVVMFAASLDGGSAFDYRLYKNNANDFAASTYAAGGQDNSLPYYSVFGGESAPASQIGSFPGQTGVTDLGEIAFRWHEVTIDKIGNNISWAIDGTLIASSFLDGVALSGDNIFFGMFDANSFSSTDPNNFLNTAIYDNVVVTVPEPSIFALTALGGLALLAFRRRAQSLSKKNRPLGAAGLQHSGTVSVRL